MRNCSNKEPYAWYVFEYNPESFTFILSIHPNSFRQLRKLVSGPNTRVMNLENSTKLPFTPPRLGSWGFNNCLKWKKTDVWPRWEIPLIPIVSPSDKGEIGMTRAIAVSATLSILAWFLDYEIVEDQTIIDSKLPQLLTLDALAVENGNNGGSLALVVFPALQRWIAKHPDIGNKLTEIMYNTYCFLKQDPRFVPYKIEFMYRESEPARFHLTVPGSGCGLDPDFHYHNPKEGYHQYKLESHNVDTRLQQLTLLSALGYVTSEVWKDLTKTHIP